MIEEQKKRSILKTLTWRITASLDTFVIAWIITGNLKMGTSIAEYKLLLKCFFIIFMNEFGIKLIGVKKNGGGYLRNFETLSA